MVDSHIISACRSGDQLSYKKVYETCAPYVYTIVKNYFFTLDDRKDVLQEVFAEVFTSIHRFDTTKGSFKSWIGRLAVNQCINFLRKQQKIHITHSLDIVEEIEDETIDTIAELSIADIEKMLVNMPDGYRTIFLLSVVEEYSHKEIGELLNITAETSRSQLFRAIKWIKKNILSESNMINYGLL